MFVIVCVPVARVSSCTLCVCVCAVCLPVCLLTLVCFSVPLCASCSCIFSYLHVCLCLLGHIMRIHASCHVCQHLVLCVVVFARVYFVYMSVSA